MSDSFGFSSGMPSEEMAEYLQMFLDETGEQLDGLVETLLVLEKSPADSAQLNEAFRLIHSIKGSAAMMGFDSITVLAHQLENHFERLRSGIQSLDRQMMDLILRCIDFLRESNRRLRAGEPLAGAPELLEELSAIGNRAVPAPEELTAAPVRSEEPEEPAQVASPPAPPAVPPPPSRDVRVVVRFEPELPLADLKAELVLTRLAGLGTVRDSLPPRAELARIAESHRLQLLIETASPVADLRTAANVDGVNLIEVDEGANAFAPEEPTAAPAAFVEVAEPVADEPTVAVEKPASTVSTLPPAASAEAADLKSKVAETVRVDIDRLDNLMNLAGELVVNKARFVQIARQLSPAFKKSGLAGRVRGFSESMRRALHALRLHRAMEGNGAPLDPVDQFHELEAELDAFEEQARLWDDSRRYFAQITEAIDQLTRVSDSLQRGVLDTRMVPVAPLFNRFKRVVRDISLELKKKVNLEISGEKTELDKRMIDELGDPLVHLVRNAIDHGIESADARARRGKPETGTLCLEAAHSGNNVYISVRDDGGGIDTEKIRKRIAERGLVAADVAAELPDRDLMEYIWHPGFSTAETVSDISGRGVGMDIVKTRITELNGTIDIQSSPGLGSTFTLRLPLTLAIIRSLLFRLRHGIFAVPIDNVREIVSVPIDQIVSIHGKRTFDVRGEFIPLVDIDDIFEWHTVQYHYRHYGGVTENNEAKRVNVVILNAAKKTMGLKVNELLGGQDIVIKSLAENFVHIRGLSGASILGDGSVCLLLDVSAAVSMAVRR